MTTAIGVVITEHIVSGRLVDFRLSGKPCVSRPTPMSWTRCPAIPGSELVELLAAPDRHPGRGNDSTPVDAIGVAVPGIVRPAWSRTPPTSPRSRACAWPTSSRKRPGRPRHRCPRAHRQRRRRHRRGRCRHARPARTSLPASGPSATASATAAGPTSKASGRAATSPSPSIPRRTLLRLRRRRPPGRHHGLPRHAPALPRPGAGRGVCAAPNRAIRAAASLSTCGTAPWPPPRPHSSTSPGRAASTLPATTSAFSIWPLSVPTWRPWSG